MSEEISDDTEQQFIAEEYRIWKKNTPFLYDTVFTSALEWPSLTVQWLPDHRKPSNNKECSAHKILLGTQSDGKDSNYLMIAEALLPNPNTPVDAKLYDEHRGEVGGYAGTLAKFDIKVRIVHEGDVHRARYMPQNPFIIATKSSHPTVLVFDYSKHSSSPTDMVCKPQHRCHGHTADGYGLSFSPCEANRLLSASSDTTICLFDVGLPQTDLQPLSVFCGHSKAVEDVDWNRFHRAVFASVSDDAQLCIWDSRQAVQTSSTSFSSSSSSSSSSSAAYALPVAPGHAMLKRAENAHDGDVNCVSFSPFDEFTLATGGSDGAVKVWDIRNLSSALHVCHGHQAGVYQVSWSPTRDQLLGSSGEDRRVMLWDLDRVGQEAVNPEEGPAELLFIHGGHSAKVFDFSWNAHEDFCLASVAEDNVLQVWQVAESIYTEYDSDAENKTTQDATRGENKRKRSDRD